MTAAVAPTIVHWMKERGGWFAAGAGGSAAAAAVSLVASCSGGSGGVIGQNGVVTTEVSYCDQREARSTKCAADSGFDAGPYNRTSCTNDYRCKSAVLAAADSYFSCRTNPDCNGKTSDDSCLAVSAQSQVAPPLADSCAKKYGACKTAGGKNFDNDLCGVLPALNQATLDKLAPCFDLACDGVDNCVEATVKAISPSCN